jgi:hypothetical protein
MCGSLFPKSSSGANWKDVGARGKAPFRAAECVYEQFWSGMGTRNDEPGPGDHPASVTHTTPHRANKEQGERERERERRATTTRSVRVLIFFLVKFLSTPFIFPPSPSSEILGIFVHNLFFFFFFKCLFF